MSSNPLYCNKYFFFLLMYFSFSLFLLFPEGFLLCSCRTMTDGHGAIRARKFPLGDVLKPPYPPSQRRGQRPPPPQLMIGGISAGCAADCGMAPFSKQRHSQLKSSSRVWASLMATRAKTSYGSASSPTAFGLHSGICCTSLPVVFAAPAHASQPTSKLRTVPPTDTPAEDESVSAHDEDTETEWCSSLQRFYPYLLEEERENFRIALDKVWIRLRRAEKELEGERQRRRSVQRELVQCLVLRVACEEERDRGAIREEELESRFGLLLAFQRRVVVGEGKPPTQNAKKHGSSRAGTSRHQRTAGKRLGPNDRLSSSSGKIEPEAAEGTYVRDSDLLRALQRAEQYIAQLELQQSRGRTPGESAGPAEPPEGGQSEDSTNVLLLSGSTEAEESSGDGEIEDEMYRPYSRHLRVLPPSEVKGWGVCLNSAMNV